MTPTEQRQRVHAIRHCSECAYYDLLPNLAMYCNRLKRRITARKKPCKHYSIYTAI